MGLNVSNMDDIDDAKGSTLADGCTQGSSGHKSAERQIQLEKKSKNPVAKDG